MEYTVYTKPNCTYCTAMKRDLTNNGIKFTEVDLTQDEEALEKVSALFSTAPVLEVVNGKRRRYYDWPSYRKADIGGGWD